MDGRGCLGRQRWVKALSPTWGPGFSNPRSSAQEVSFTTTPPCQRSSRWLCFVSSDDLGCLCHLVSVCLPIKWPFLLAYKEKKKEPCHLVK